VLPIRACGLTADSAATRYQLQARPVEYRRTLVRAIQASRKPRPSGNAPIPVPTSRKDGAAQKKNCQFAPMRRNKDRYVSSWTCPTVSGPMRFRDVLIAKDATGYQDVSGRAPGSV